MKILMVNKFLYPRGGSESYMLKLGEELENQGHEVEYFGMYDEKNTVGNSIENYTKAIELYPYMGDAYFNRGLVLIYLKDKEKGCIDLSRAGELGIQDAYGVIKKFCEEENE